MLQLSVNYPGNPLCAEYIYQPYMYEASVNYSVYSLCEYQPHMEHWLTTLVILHVMMLAHNHGFVCCSVFKIYLCEWNAHTTESLVWGLPTFTPVIYCDA